MPPQILNNIEGDTFSPLELVAVGQVLTLLLTSCVTASESSDFPRLDFLNTKMGTIIPTSWGWCEI